MASEQLEPISVYFGPSIERLFSIHEHNLNEKKQISNDIHRILVITIQSDLLSSHSYELPTPGS
jgi:hypothetical protein